MLSIVLHFYKMSKNKIYFFPKSDTNFDESQKKNSVYSLKVWIMLKTLCFPKYFQIKKVYMFWLLMQFQHSKWTLEIIRVDFYDYGFLWHIMLFLWAIFFSPLIHYIGSKLRDGGGGTLDTPNPTLFFSWWRWSE